MHSRRVCFGSPGVLCRNNVVQRSTQRFVLLNIGCEFFLARAKRIDPA
ncbi:hypothetical protein K788_0006950 (plasmid) [Paraburkholderia caribensis MBA4]|uniref:Uncharacterized protein n=1 Tax=Paraburkholderia caribensis MBA4 TaxID=1323664 RepID=A0A0P0RPL3_9BURK|nr:hypothetical protein K788_0006950 [Paraburkholderia caribensis MBA4]